MEASASKGLYLNPDSQLLSSSSKPCFLHHRLGVITGKPPRKKWEDAQEGLTVPRTAEPVVAFEPVVTRQRLGYVAAGDGVPCVCAPDPGHLRGSLFPSGPWLMCHGLVATGQGIPQVILVHLGRGSESLRGLAACLRTCLSVTGTA